MSKVMTMALTSERNEDKRSRKIEKIEKEENSLCFVKIISGMKFIIFNSNLVSERIRLQLPEFIEPFIKQGATEEDIIEGIKFQYGDVLDYKLKITATKVKIYIRKKMIK